MKRKVARLRLSPNEEAQLIREEHERRRKLRIQQVREQERCIALQIRQEVQRRRERELHRLEEELREDWTKQQKEKLDSLQTLYQESLLLVGQGHRSAKENEPDWSAVAQKEEENQAKAEERHREALRELQSQRQRDQEEQNRSINARRKALRAEKERSAKVASLPPPPPNPIESIESKKQPLVKKCDINAFSATHYHMPETAVDREADAVQPNAQEVAEVEARRLQELGRDAEREREEQQEKARLRGKHALRREQLTQDRERLLVQLEHMQQTDLLRRRQQVAQMPAQIFQPLHKRQQAREDGQREMEFAFEDMYTGERRVKGDLVLQLVPEPLPALSTDSQDQDQELDLTLEDVTTTPLEVTQRAGEARRDTRRQAGSAEQEAQGEPSRPAGGPPRRALKRLLDRIRSQRDQWTGQGGGVPPPPEQPTSSSSAAPRVPERDMSIDTGSLSSSPRPPGPSQSPPASEKKEESIVAGTLLPPGAQADRIQTFEEERKRREEELEREKQQQVALLQELEEQKARLEQMLLDAQQERETLKAAVTQEVPVDDPEVPVHDQEVTSVAPGSAAEQPVAGADEDDHARRIREYQQRLMEQNRLHHRSVEVARKRLEEYQRTLHIRYNLAAISAPSPAVHPPLHSAGVAAPLPHLLHSAGVTVPLPHPLHAAGVTAPLAHFLHSAGVAAPLAPSLHSAGVAVPLAPPLHSAGVTVPLPHPLHSAGGTVPLAHFLHSAGVTAPLVPPLQLSTGSAMPAHIPEANAQSPAPGNIPTRNTAILAQPPSHPGSSLSSKASLGIDSRALPVRPESSTESARDQRAGVAAWLTDSIMERVTDHLPERLRPSSLTVDHPPCRPPTSRAASTVPPPPHSHPGPAVGPSMADGPPPLPGQASFEPGPFLQDSPQEDMERQKQELQEVHRRVQEQRGAMAQQQREQEEARWRQEEEREQMRRQREMLQALIHTDAQPASEVADEGMMLQDVGELRRRLLGSLLRAIEESNEGTLSSLQDDGVDQPLLSRGTLSSLRDDSVDQPLLSRGTLSSLQDDSVDQPLLSRGTLSSLRDDSVDQPLLSRGTLSSLQDDRVDQPLLSRGTLSSLRDGSVDQPLLSRGTLSSLRDDGVDQPLLSRGTLSSLQDDCVEQPLLSRDSTPPQSDTLTGPAPPAPLRPDHHLPPKPPVARVRLGFMEMMMSEQHELSAIQEVETPVNASLVTGPDDGVRVLLPPALSAVLQEESEASVVSVDSVERPLRSASASSGGEQSAGRGTASGAGSGSGRSSKLSWRERLMMEAGASSEPAAAPPSQSSSDSGRGGTAGPGPVVTGYTSSPESTHRPLDPDCLSSTTISTGSYITTDPEQNSCHTEDTSLLLARLGVEGGGGRGGLGLLDMSHSYSQRTYDGDDKDQSGAQRSYSQRTYDGDDKDQSGAGRSYSQRSYDGDDKDQSGAGRSYSQRSYDGDDKDQSGAGRSYSQRTYDGDDKDQSGAGRSYSQRTYDGDDKDQSGAGRSYSQRTYDGDDKDQSGAGRSYSQRSDEGDDRDQSGAGPLSPAIDSLFHSSTIQRIIDKYTRELDISLNTAGNTTASSADRASLEEPGGSEQRPSAAAVQEDGPEDSPSLPSDTESGAQRRGLEWDNTVNQILERFSGQASPLTPGPESSFSPLIGQPADESSFSPLIGQPADESSCLAADQRDSPMARLIDQRDSPMARLIDQRDSPMARLIDQRDSPMARLIGQPTAHSSMIGPGAWPCQPAAEVGGVDQGGWDSTLGRMIGRLSHQSSSQWLSGGRDFYAGQLIGQAELERLSWLDGGQDDSQMRPLLGELDESGALRSGSSGGRDSVDPGGSAQSSVSSAQASAPEAPSHGSAAPGPDPPDQIVQMASGPQQQDPGMSGASMASDCFHTLLAEITQNETVDPSMTFHLPEEEVSSSSAGSGHAGLSVHSGGRPGEEVETCDDLSVTSDPSPERFRAGESSSSSSLPTAARLQESFYQLPTCHGLPLDSLTSPGAQEVELAALSLSGLTLRYLPPQEGDSRQRNSAPIWDQITEAAGEKGILEESQLTLVSLTDQDTTIEKEMEEEEETEEREEGQKTEKEEELETTLLPEETPASSTEESMESSAVMLLEFHWSPSTAKQQATQQKRRALHQRSAQRVEDMKTKRALAKALSEGHSDTKTQSALGPVSTTKPKGNQCQAEDLACKPKGNQCQAEDLACKPKGNQCQAEDLACNPKDKSSGAAEGSKLEEPQLPLPASKARLKKVGEVRICTPEQRKQDVSAMHQRTQRLYEQLEEVKQQKEIRSRQESYTKNRQKAKEFHKKTLLKLRAKQTPQ